jgi:hypothetical protein
VVDIQVPMQWTSKPAGRTTYATGLPVVTPPLNGRGPPYNGVGAANAPHIVKKVAWVSPFFVVDSQSRRNLMRQYRGAGWLAVAELPEFTASEIHGRRLLEPVLPSCKLVQCSR